MHVSGVLEGAGTENGVEVPPEERKAQVQNLLRGAGRVMTPLPEALVGPQQSTEETATFGRTSTVPGQTPDPSAQREGPNGPLRGRAPEDSQPVGPWSHAQRGRPASPNRGQAGHLPGHVPLAPQALQPRPRPKSPPSTGTRASGIPPQTRKSPQGPVSPSPPLRSGH